MPGFPIVMPGFSIVMHGFSIVMHGLTGHLSYYDATNNTLSREKCVIPCIECNQ